MSTTYEERKIVTIHGPADANALQVFCRASIEVSAGRYPKTEGWEGPFVKADMGDWILYVCRDAFTKARNAPAIGGGAE